MSEFRRQHPVAAVTQLIGLLRQNLVPIIVFIVVGTRNSGDYFWYIFLFGVVSTFVLGIAGWYRFTYRVHEDELQINKGIFVRKKLYLTKERIQVIDITEGLVQRVFGLVKLEVKSAGSGTESATISAITRTEAEELRKVLRENGSAGVLKKEEVEIAPETLVTPSENKVWRLSGRSLVLAAFSSGNFGFIASILGAISGQLDQFITEENLEYLYDKIPGYSNSSVFIGLFIFIMIVSYIFSFLGIIFKYADFKIERNDKELLITSGLLERKHITIPFNRIQAVRFVEGILRQPFGYGMLYVESAGFEQKNQEKSIVAVPFIKKHELDSFFNDFIPDYELPETTVTPPKRAFFRYLRRPNYLLFVAVPAIWFFWELGWVFWIFAIPFTMFGWLRYGDAQIAFNDRIMKLQYRVLAKSTALVQRNRAQISEMKMNPFQRRKGLADVQVTAASGAGGINFSVSDLDYEEALNVFRWSVDEQ